MDFSLASIVPRRVGSPEQARAEVAARGAAIVSGLGDQEAAFAAGRADAGGEGASFAIDGLRLLDLMADDPEYADVARFAWETDIDQSEPNFPLAAYAPVARRLPGSGRVQVRHHPFQAPVPGQAPDLETVQEALIGRRSQAVTAARDSGPMFGVEAGDMICVDNYRVTHGRDGYSAPERVMLSIWGWSSTAIAVPEGPLDIVRPVIPPALSGTR